MTAFAEKISKRVHAQRGLLFITWPPGLLVIDDYFAPLSRGVVLRPLTDKAKISREKLAYVLDSTTASVCVLLPFAAWGAYNSSKLDENLKLISELISEINILNFGPKSGEQFGKIKADLMYKGKILNDSDIIIAASAISNDLILVTNNEKHFKRIENLSTQNWTKQTNIL